MNKQELIERLKGEQQRCDIAGSDIYNYITPSQPGEIAIQCKAQARAYEHAITLAQHLDEPSREECEFIEWSAGDDGDYGGCVDGAKCTNCDYFEAWYFHYDKFNFCPNCGAKIKRENRKDE